MNLFPIKLAGRYIFSGKNAIEVNVISWISFLSLGFVTACLIVILSVFSGLEEINIQFYGNVNPDIKIEASKGKSFLANDSLMQIIDKTPGITTTSKVLEERAFIDYMGKNHIITVKGVDKNFNKIFGLDSLVLFGENLDFNNPQSLIIGPEVSSRLSLYIDEENPVNLYVPKPGKGLITSQDDAFNEVNGFSKGIFRINDKYSQFVFSNLSLAQDLLNYKPNQVSAIEIRTDRNNNEVKLYLEKKLGGKFRVLTKQELNAAFMKMMNTENLIIYLIFILILFIASFNLAGSVAILILNKQNQSSTLHSLGLNISQIKRTFFYTGLLISFYALVFGLVIGSVLVFAQEYFGLVRINEFLAFPVKFNIFNYLITIVSVLGIGSIISWFVSREVKL